MHFPSYALGADELLGCVMQNYKDTVGLKSVFEDFGVLKDCNMPFNRTTGQGKGFAFVDFRSSIDAEKCVNLFN